MDTINSKIIFEIIVFCLGYTIVLIGLSPIIDHLFPSLKNDESKKKSYIKILVEVILHIIVLSTSWYYTNHNLQKFLEYLLNTKISENTELLIDITSSIVLVGLQYNLMNKLNYLSINHSFRSFNL